MTTSLPAPAPLPFGQSPERPFDPPAGLAELRAEHPLSRLTYNDGHIGWLVTNRELIRAVMADPRFSSRTELMHFPFPGVPTDSTPPAAPPGAFVDMDAPEHTRYRKLLVGQFTVRRMRQLTQRITEITADRLAAMRAHGPGVDLVEAFALPIPSLVICELLGVPYDERAHFQQHAATVVGESLDMAAWGDAFRALQEYLGVLVTAKRANPTDDMLSGLAESDLTDEELTNIGVVLLGAGIDTTANVLGLGAAALLRDPRQVAALLDDPDRAVEELLRYLTIAPTTVRAALTDVELGGQLIRAGDSVTLSLESGNRDSAHFTEADSLDVGRGGSGHLAFGHGIHQCLGQQLARVELRVAFPALFKEFPSLRLAVADREVPYRTGGLMRGVRALPVAWSD
ncbi:cytochrome P450 [Actinokineospora auranticolor]|uniref:Cytochrome P450 n=1 Tax=Actinokineospora auranticolor TaxID=155976 RepID=A0A2S6GCL4_9PSEU|nr:cytochrome P450 [Actinokineospora auranticolor]PPK62585.1 cytochrome P450 [Actinokineospora auranticolor]